MEITILTSDVSEVNYCTIKAGATRYTHETGARAYVWAIENGRFLAKGYTPKGKKHLFYWSCRTEAEATKYATNLMESYDASMKRKLEDKAKRNQECTLKVGDIIYSSWGYEQTNIDWYEVVAIKGKKVTVESIGGDLTESGFMSGYTTPNKNIRTGNFSNHIVQYGNQLKFKSYAYGYLWDGTKKYCSWYA